MRQIVGIGRIGRCRLGLPDLAQNSQPFLQCCPGFELAAVGLHHPGDARVQLFPTDAALLCFQWRIDARFFALDLPGIDANLRGREGIGRRFSPRVAPARRRAGVCAGAIDRPTGSV